jgi:hypothetical protein
VPTAGRRRIEHLRPLAVFLPLAGDPVCLRSSFRADPERWLPDARSHGEDCWSTVVHGVGWSQRVAMRVGAPWSSTNTLWRSLSWEPLRAEEGGDRPVRHLPTFDGELGLFVAGDRATLAIEGRYRAPGGPFGAVLDGLALHRVARGTADRLMEDVAARLREAAKELCPGSDAAEAG